jgi:hypothetical protein
MFGLFDGLFDRIFGKDSTVGTIFKYAAGIAVGGGMGYLVYKGVKAAIGTGSTANTKAVTKAPQSSVSSSTGSEVVWNSSTGKWEPKKAPVYSAQPLQSSGCTGIKIDPSLCRECKNETCTPTKTAAQLAGEASYKRAYNSYLEGKAAGTNVTTPVTNSTRWTTKITTADGEVIYKDGQGGIATRGDNGQWVLTNSSGQYVATG